MVREILCLKNHSLKTQLVISFISILLLFITGLAITNYQEQKSFLHKNHLNESKQLINMISRSILDSMITNDVAGVDEKAKYLIAGHLIDSYAVFDSLKRNLSSTPDFKNEISKKIFREKKDFIILQENESKLEILSPLVFQNESIGWIYVNFSRQHLKQAFNEQIWKTAKLFSIAGFLGIIISIFLANILTSQLKDLQKSIQHITANNDFSIRAKENTNNEIGKIAHSFNLMAEKIIEYQSNMVTQAKFTALGEMASGIAHEVNNPLTIITGKIQFLITRSKKNTLTPEFLNEELAKIQKTAYRISKIISALRSFTQDSLHEEKEFLPLSHFIDSTLELCNEKIKMENIDLKIKVDNTIHIYACPNLIRQVFFNMISNSIDAIEALEDKWIIIESIVDDHQVIIKFRDSGSGISHEIQSKLMQPFFTTKETGKGTGLGLSTSKGILEKHHGKIYYNAKSNHTEFIIELPKLEKDPRSNSALNH